MRGHEIGPVQTHQIPSAAGIGSAPGRAL